MRSEPSLDDELLSAGNVGLRTSQASLEPRTEPFNRGTSSSRVSLTFGGLCFANPGLASSYPPHSVVIRATRIHQQRSLCHSPTTTHSLTHSLTQPILTTRADAGEILLARRSMGSANRQRRIKALRRRAGPEAAPGGVGRPAPDGLTRAGQLVRHRLPSRRARTGSERTTRRGLVVAHPPRRPGGWPGSFLAARSSDERTTQWFISGRP